MMIEKGFFLCCIVWLTLLGSLQLAFAGEVAGPLTACADTAEAALKEEKLSQKEYEIRYRDEALRLLNQYRRVNGVKRLSYSKRLQKAAELRAMEALKHPQRGHQRYDKKGKRCSFSSAVADLKVHIQYSGIGENLAWRAYQISPEAAARGMFEQWKASPSHRKNMLDKRYNAVAIAIACDRSGKKSYEYGAASAQLFIKSKK